METLKFQLYERRLNNCLAARDRCKEGSWGWTYWQDCFTILTADFPCSGLLHPVAEAPGGRPAQLGNPRDETAHLPAPFAVEGRRWGRSW